MFYVTEKMAKNAIQKMQDFHESVRALYDTFNIDLLENSGRRNVVMSFAQEKFFAEEIKKSFPQASSDGRTGQADIIIPELSRELECKLTSGSGKYSSFDLQTDWETLSKKGALDYLYVLASRNFDKFVVLFFSQLSPDDFFPPSPGARGKSRMNKQMSMKKCQVLLGGVITRNEVEVEKLAAKINDANKKKADRLDEIDRRMTALGNRAYKRKLFLQNLQKKETNRFNKKINKLFKKVNYWNGTSPKFRFQFETICIEDGAACYNPR